jgi:hypothetical protein
MIFCARATRGLRRPSPGLMAHLGVPVGGRVKKRRAVEDQSAPIPEDISSGPQKDGKGRGYPGWSCAPGTRALRRASFDGCT